ncbi:MAG TPA: hypothetical protein VK052_06715 [Zeimonas sp.]|nr:hypothetical protein [Zeimonas sp.]
MRGLPATLRRRCHRQVAIALPRGVDAWGQADYGPATTYRAYVEQQVQLARTDRGDEHVTTLRIFLPDAPVVPADAQITVDGEPVPLLGVEQWDSPIGQPWVTVLLTGPALARPRQRT